MNWTLRWRRPGMVAGIAISLALHILLIFGYRLRPPAAPPEPPARTMTVWLQPPKPPAPVAEVEPPPPPKPAQPRKREKTGQLAARPSQPAPAAAQAITLPGPVQSAQSTAPDPLHPEEQPKQFDMNEALKTARKVAKEKDPARAGTAVAQLDDHPLYPEQTASELARKMEGAKRSDCRKTGNIFAPLIWLLDKKDSGCKW